MNKNRKRIICFQNGCHLKEKVLLQIDQTFLASQCKEMLSLKIKKKILTGWGKKYK